MARFPLLLGPLLAFVFDLSNASPHPMPNPQFQFQSPDYPLHPLHPGPAVRMPYRTRKITRETCPISQRPHCCADFPLGQTDITKYDSCMPLLPGDTCKAQTICCVVLQGHHPPADYVMRRYACSDVTMLKDGFTDPHELYYGARMDPFLRVDAAYVDGYNNPKHELVSVEELNADPANDMAQNLVGEGEQGLQLSAAQGHPDNEGKWEEYSTDESSEEEE